ncbi:hypothetical protein [Bordetella petrii]|uniref:hypothetical protein n=1 Tax=Bordetella petrii TaxID=94624 RepID=UPI001A977B4F|nr:hypothetical protein [Bordetella petrii]MBO1112875.1 hypothetical protein [Bordetella petrii]
MAARLLASAILGAAALLPGWAAAAPPAAAGDAGRQALAAYQAAQGDPGQLRHALALADQALQQAPGDAALLLLRADIHTARRHYTQALADYAELPDAGLQAERKMMQCMLRERVQPAPLPLDCYAEAGRRFAAGQAAPGHDPNYVMAMLLARDPQGPRLAADLLAATPAGPQRDINIMLFQDFDRTRYLRSVLP